MRPGSQPFCVGLPRGQPTLPRLVLSLESEMSPAPNLRAFANFHNNKKKNNNNVKLKKIPPKQ